MEEKFIAGDLLSVHLYVKREATFVHHLSIRVWRILGTMSRGGIILYITQSAGKVVIHNKPLPEFNDKPGLNTESSLPHLRAHKSK